MGKDAASMRFTPSKTNAYQTLNRLRNEIHETHIPEALKSDKNALKKYNEAKNFAHKEYYPFITGKNLQKVSEGATNTLSPKQFNSAIQKAIESRQMAKAAIHGKHPLIKALKSGTKAVEKGEALQNSMPLISALMGAVGGPFGAATGGTLGHFVLPHALKLAQNAYVNKNGERVHKAIRAALAEAGNRTNQNTPMELTLIGGHKK